jgi:O-antigen/teichoic acid export membrane protein
MAEASDRAGTVRKLIELAMTHVATFAFPLVFAVICGRTLGIHDYGIVSFYAALAAFLGMIIEFGFDWYGIREVARHPAQPAAVHRILWNITAAKLLLCAGVGVVAGGALWQWRGHAEWPLMLASLAYLIGFAFDAGWYVRALEQTRLLLLITSGVRLIGIAVLLLVVPQVATMESALGVYALVSLLTSAVTWLSLARRGLVRHSRVEFRYIGQLLRSSSAIVFGNVNGAMLTNGGIALLGLQADPATVGAANLALRVRMAGQAVMLPVQQLGFVRISGLASRAPRAAMALGSRLVLVTLAIGVVISVVCMLAAPLISAYVFKAEVPLAVVLILLLAFSIPIQGMASLFGMQSLIALGQERRYALIQLAATLAFCACLFLIDQGSAYGWAIIGAETTVMLLSAGVLIRLRREMML